jgi:nucleolar protein 14
MASKARLSINKNPNPFDVKITKPKHDVGGRKIKGVIGQPARSKQAGLEQVGFPYSRLVRRLIIPLCAT